MQKNAHDVLNALAAIISAKGKTYVYSNSSTPRDPSTFGESQTCFYRNADAEGGARCIVGEVYFHLFGVEVPHSVAPDGSIRGAGIGSSPKIQSAFTETACHILSLCQSAQDYGAAWGICLVIAERYLGYHPEPSA